MSAVSWWSWAVIAYLGLMASFWLVVAGLYGAVRLAAHLRCRRLVSEAERFLAGIAAPVASPHRSL